MKSVLCCLLLPSLLFLFSCNPDKNGRVHDLKTESQDLEKKLSRNERDTSMLHDLAQKVDAFAKDYPGDTISGALLFDLAGRQWQMKEFRKAMATFERIGSEIKNDRYDRRSLHSRALLYLTALNQPEEARKLLEQYLKQYGGADAAETANVQAELESIGKTPEQLLQQIQQHHS